MAGGRGSGRSNFPRRGGEPRGTLGRHVVRADVSRPKAAAEPRGDGRHHERGKAQPEGGTAERDASHQEASEPGRPRQTAKPKKEKGEGASKAPQPKATAQGEPRSLPLSPKPRPQSGGGRRRRKPRGTRARAGTRTRARKRAGTRDEDAKAKRRAEARRARTSRLRTNKGGGSQDRLSQTDGEMEWQRRQDETTVQEPRASRQKRSPLQGATALPEPP